ncbi:hypothetical protein SDC9_49001 [bioreactor metagenome]|uniref:Tetratricopeptide repeat protein n=1 Tax=bioreactor metagenome TaxID=1076179 RepID=A0A644WFW4_9ZZZZ
MNNKTYISPPEQEDDPFLRDAQEGWAQFPGAQSRWWKKKLQFNLFLLGKSWSVLPAVGKLAVGTLTSVAIITVAAVTIPFNFNKEQPVIVQQEKYPSQKNTETLTEEKTEENLQDSKDLSLAENQNETETRTIAAFDRNIPLPVSDYEAENTIFFSADAQEDLDEMAGTDKKNFEATGRISPLEAKNVKMDNSAFDDALPYIWVDQYRLLDYDALNADIPRPAATTSTAGLEPRYSNREEKKESDASVSVDTISYKTFVGDALIKVKYGNYPEAEYQFKKLLTQKPADENALFYLGYCSYQQGNYTQALGYFEKTKKSTYKAFASDADWYLANIYLKTGERTKAKNMFKKIERQEGSYKDDAEKMLEKEFNE